MKNLEDYIESINNFPKEGIVFRDVTSVLSDKDGLKLAIDSMQEELKDIDFDIVVAPESRGFIFGMPIAYNMNKAFVPVRKKGKLPRETIEQEYSLEYGTAILQMHKDSIKPGDRVVIVDDLIATGGTIEEIIKMVEKLGGKVVRVCALIELVDLKARELLKDTDIFQQALQNDCSFIAPVPISHINLLYIQVLLGNTDLRHCLYIIIIFIIFKLHYLDPAIIYNSFKKLYEHCCQPGQYRA